MAEAFDQDNKEISEYWWDQKWGNEAKLINNDKLSNQDIHIMMPNRKELDSYKAKV